MEAPRHDYLVCIDSDGCAFDVMDIKHQECFCPATIHAWGLQPISRYVRQAWDYGNLYSIHRGRSRFIELVMVFDWLAEREEVKRLGFELPNIDSYREWLKTRSSRMPPHTSRKRSGRSIRTWRLHNPHR